MSGRKRVLLGVAAGLVGIIALTVNQLLAGERTTTLPSEVRTQTGSTPGPTLSSPGEPSPSQPACLCEVKIDGLLYGVPGKKWFGGFLIAVVLDDGSKVGFSDPVRGPGKLYDQLALSIIHQTEGRYGGTTRALESYLAQHDYIVPDIELPRGDPATPLSYSGYVPSIVVASAPTAVDLSKAVVISQDLGRPWAAHIWGFHTGSAFESTVIATHSGQLYILDTMTFVHAGDVAVTLNFYLESIAQLHLASALPRNYSTPSGPGSPARGLLGYLARALGFGELDKVVLDPAVFGVKRAGWSYGEGHKYKSSLLSRVTP
jgi:hypothetical protein